VGFDVDPVKVARLTAGESYIRQIPAARITALNAGGRFRATERFDQLAQVDVVVICVPTPLDGYRTPDLSFVENSARQVAAALRPGQLVVLESTTYPGTTRELVEPILGATGLVAGEDYLLAYSPEREDPGNDAFNLTRVPKVVGADHPLALDAAARLYRPVVQRVVTVSSAATAEAVKLTENIFRAVNIALVNELKLIYARLGIDIWEVIEAAKTKPFGFMPFYPGPGLGGHCIPIDPFYLSWKAREVGIEAHFVELAGEVNKAMPAHVVGRLADALNDRFARCMNGAHILVIGMAYKKNVDDIRESPGLELLRLLHARRADIAYYDPFIPEIPFTRHYPELGGMRSIAWSQEAIGRADAVLICTDHDEIDYESLVAWSKLVVDTRNVTRRVAGDRSKVVLA
jgi:UDP-N-acetyl-D-glucosamine dehydrogenase